MLQRMVLAFALLVLTLPVAADTVLSPYGILSDFMSTMSAVAQSVGAYFEAISPFDEFGGSADPQGITAEGDLSSEEYGGLIDFHGVGTEGDESASEEYGGYIDPHG